MTTATQKMAELKKRGIAFRVVTSAVVPPEDLLANPRNFRRHPSAQLDRLQAIIERVGWVDAILVNTRTGFVVDGHARVELAIREGWALVPVDYIDVGPAEELVILRFFDEISAMAYVDDDALAALQADLESEESVRQLVTFLASTDTPTLDDPEASGSQLGDVTYQVVVDVASERDQAQLLERLEREGFSCKALML